MSDNNSQDPENEAPPSGSELEAVFRQWEKERPGLDDDPAPYEPALSDDELLLEHELARRPEAIVDRARRATRIRLLLMVVLVAACAVTLFANREDFGFYLLNETDLVDYGDLRKQWIDGGRPGKAGFAEFSHNRWVRLRGAIMTEERESTSGTFFFYEPMTHMVVVTSRSLPEKNPRNNSIHGAFAPLINQRWMFPTDLSAEFSGQGRLLTEDSAPRRYRPILQAYRDLLLLDKRLPEGAQLWLFLDDVSPSSQRLYLYIYLIAFFVVVLSGVIYWRARRRLRQLEELLDTAPDLII